MIDNNRVLAIIPARGGSKGVTQKNIKNLCGKPLIYYSIEAGSSSKYIDRLVVSTEDKKIEDIAKKHNVEVIKRPEELSLDDTPSVTVFKHVLSYLQEKERYEPEIIVILQPTSPLRGKKEIDECIEKLIQEKCDSVITVKKVDHPPQWMLRIDEEGKVKDYLKDEKINRRQDAENIYIPNGAVFVTWSKILMKQNSLKGPDTRALIMPFEKSVDIDTELDFYIAEKLLKK